MVDLKTNYAGLTLRNPLIVGSSGLSAKVEKIKEFAKAGAAAVVLKSLFEEQIERQADSLLRESDSPEAQAYVHEYLRAHQVQGYLELIKEAKASCDIPVIASINCYKAGEWIDFARQVEQAGADAIELNVYFMETDPDQEVEMSRRLYADIAMQVKAAISIPLMVKLSKSVGNVPALAKALKLGGADGIVLFNRFFQPDIDITTLQLASGNVFSEHAELNETLRWTAIVSGKVPGLPIASSTGVHDWEDLVKCLLAGASAVEMVSALYTSGAKLIPQLLTCLEEWMTQAHYRSLSEFRGKLNYARIADPGMYERAQFMKYFSNRD
ncbi:MAG: dihydroorotate dehydrogenase-like protein [Tannerella sp.]|jgi:dihydroorotate dehydrogenase (fumarate)|nr:dihydroorotate dehydrogenase-like protein [Tannerella sp.]